MSGPGKPCAVAFLQNMWVRDPVRARAALARHGQKWWRLATRQFLFAGCVTGRRLCKAFGPLADEIIWEESTQEIAGDARTICQPDPRHIQSVLNELNPKAVLAFGQVAGNAVFRVLAAGDWKTRFITAPHPAARQADVPARLREAAATLGKELCL